MADNIKAYELAKQQREISISEFFLKNRHLLGFDNPTRALMMVVKEAVDNSLDATTEMKVLPEIKVELQQINEDRFKVIVEDNGPGIVKQQIPNIFGKLLYGSKFHTLKMNRGQQGLGVCMTHDTLIPLCDGRVLPIKELVDNRLNADLFVLSPNLNLCPGKIDRFWRIQSPQFLINLKVLGGKEIKLTSENPLLVRNEKGLKWEYAESVKIGDYIAISRRLDIPTQEQKIPIFDLLDKDTRVNNYKFVNKLLNELRKKYGTWNSVAKKFSIEKDNLIRWRNKKIRRRPTKEIIEIFAKDLGMSGGEIINNCIIVGKLGTYVKIPKYVNNDFMRFLGFISGDGYSQKKIKNRWGRNISFWNDNNLLQAEFKKIVKRLFGINTKLIKHSKGRGQMTQFSSSLIARLINNCGIPSGKKFDVFKLSSFLHRKYLLRPYLQALFDCEGSVSVDRKNVSFMIRNKKMISYINLFLLQFGIISRINKIGDDNRIVISGMKNLYKFDKEISFSCLTKKNLLKSILKNSDETKHSNLELVPFIRNQVIKLMQDLNVSYKRLPHSQTISKNRKVFTFSVLKELVNFFSSKVDRNKLPIELQELYCLLNSDVVWTKVISAEKIKSNDVYVYDLTMKRGNNFIANGLVVHNSAAVLYSQLTTGKSVRITSKIDPKKPAHYFELQIDTKTNEPRILKDQEINWDKEHGTKIEIEIEGRYLKGKQSVDEYIKETAIVNPHATIIYITPEKEKIVYERVTEELPKEAKEIKPHPYGIELGHLIKMLQDTRANTLQGFLQSDFSRIGQQTAQEICKNAKLKYDEEPKKLDHKQIEILFKVLQETKIMAPPSDCLSPIGAEFLEEGLRKEIQADFYVTATRSPSVYRGMPFQVEVSIVYGGEIDKESQVRLMRFANRVPLLYQQGACAITEAVTDTNWKPYGLNQSGNNLPTGPAVILVHIASVWVPFTNEAKEAIAHYDEIIKEMKLALQECGRKLSIYIHKKHFADLEDKKRSYIEKYLPHIGIALKEIINLNDSEKEKVLKILEEILEKTRVNLNQEFKEELINEQEKENETEE